MGTRWLPDFRQWDSMLGKECCVIYFGSAGHILDVNGSFSLLTCSPCGLLAAILLLSRNHGLCPSGSQIQSGIFRNQFYSCKRLTQ